MNLVPTYQIKIFNKIIRLKKAKKLKIDIKLRFNIPPRQGFYYVHLIIRNLTNQNQIEEIEKFHFNAE